MRKTWLVLVLLGASTRLFAAENQSYLAILAETRVHKMAGMPAISELPPGLDLSAMPGLASMLGGAPERSLEVRLWSPGLAPANAAASIAPPAGLQLGKKLDLDLYRPKADAVAPAGPGEFDPDSVKGFTINIYWGSSDTVKPGQPKVIKWEGLTAEQKQAMKKQASKSSAGGAYFYKPNWTTGYWPTPKQPGKIAQGASLVGDYALTTNYTGNVTVSAPPDVNFLAPFDLTSPKLDAVVPLDKPIALAWKQIPNALGLHAAIFGMEGKDTLILWSSSEVYTDDMLADWGYLQMSRVRELVGLTAMMMGDRTSVTVPAGIFGNSDVVMLTMVGHGPGAALDQGQPLPRIQTKTTLTATLGGKAVSGLDGTGGTGEVGDTGDADF